jgi:hypothetical protein
VALGKFSPSTSVSPVNLHSTKFSIFTITRGSYNRPEVADVPSGPSLDSTPHYANLKKIMSVETVHKITYIVVVPKQVSMP